ETIRRLQGSDNHFRHLYDEYHRLDDEIYRIEEEIDFATDQEIEELKMRRAKLKDYIYHLIRHAPAASERAAAQEDGVPAARSGDTTVAMNGLRRATWSKNLKHLREQEERPSAGNDAVGPRLESKTIRRRETK